MNLFGKKETYTIISDKEISSQIQELIEEIGAKNTATEIDFGEDTVSIEFKTKVEHLDIIDWLVDKFAQDYCIEMVDIFTIRLKKRGL